MPVVCRITISESSTPQQLKQLADDLERWIDYELDHGGCHCSVDDQQLADLQEGELPQPAFLNRMAFMKRLEDGFKSIVGRLPDGYVPLERFQREYLKEEMGDESRSRDLNVLIEYPAEFEDKEAPVANMKSQIDESIIAKIEVSEVPEEDSSVDLD